MSAAICPECEAEIDFGNPVEVQIGERLFCPECDMELEVISVKPLALDYAFDDDWEDEDWKIGTMSKAGETEARFANNPILSW